MSQIAHVPNILEPQTPSLGGSFVQFKQKGAGSALVGAASAGCEVGGGGNVLGDSRKGGGYLSDPTPDLGRENQVQSLPCSRASMKLSVPESNIDPFP